MKELINKYERIFFLLRYFGVTPSNAENIIKRAVAGDEEARDDISFFFHRRAGYRIRRRSKKRRGQL